MSQVFEALRKAEQQAKAKAEPDKGPEVEVRPSASAAPGVGPAAAPGAAAAAAPAKPSAELKHELSLLAIRLETAREQLEALIADTRRVREGFEEQLERSQKKVQESSLAAMRAGAATLKAEFAKGMELLAEGAADRAGHRIGEQMAATVESLGKTALAELSESLVAGLAQAAEEMSERFRQSLENVARGVENEAVERFESKAESLVESGSKTLAQQIDDSVDLFTERLSSASRELVTEATCQVEKAKADAEGATRELGAAVDACRRESGKIVRELKAVVAREFEAQRGAALRQLDEESRQALARVKESLSEVEKASDALHQQVGRGALAIREYQDQARASLEAGFRQVLEALAEEAGDVCRAALVEHRREMGLLMDEVRARIQQAAEAFLGSNREGR